jgi:hypothetical protein
MYEHVLGIKLMSNLAILMVFLAVILGLGLAYYLFRERRVKPEDHHQEIYAIW